MRGKVNEFEFHGIKSGDGMLYVAIRCHVCRKLLRSSYVDGHARTSQFTHCGRVYKKQRHLKGSNMPVVESKTSKRLTRRLRRRVLKEIDQDRAAKAEAVRVMGSATRDSLEDSLLFERYVETNAVKEKIRSEFR